MRNMTDSLRRKIQQPYQVFVAMNRREDYASS
jgi:hypothetical protein